MLHSCFTTAIIVFECIQNMPTQKSKKKSTSQVIKANDEQKTTPRTAKIVLFVFGLGPLILMSVFLYSNGFFNSP